jgi:hypothetical protein
MIPVGGFLITEQPGATERKQGGFRAGEYCGQADESQEQDYLSGYIVEYSHTLKIPVEFQREKACGSVSCLAVPRRVGVVLVVCKHIVFH